MRNLTEFFEYVKNTSQDDLMKEVKFVVNENSEEVLAGICVWSSVLTYLNYYLLIPKQVDKTKEDEIMTVKEVCSYLKLNDKTVRKLINQRKLEGYEIGTVDKKDARGTLRVKKSACEIFLLSCKI
jgi:excisionase family DNA binding protein